MKIPPWFFLLLLPLCVNAAPDFTTKEREWLARHPVVHYNYPVAWPVDYERDGQHVGLTRDYLDIIAQMTGIRFEPVWPDSSGKFEKPPLMHSAVAPQLLNQEEMRGWLYTQPFLRVRTVVVTPGDSHTIFRLEQLSDRRISIRRGSFFESWLENNIPGIKLEFFDDLRQALSDLSEKKLDAVVGTELAIRPIVRTYFPGKLEIAGTLDNQSAGISLAVRDNEPELLSILDKSLSSLTARQTGTIYNNWLDDLDINIGTPSLSTVLYYYHYEIIVFGILVVLLSGTLIYAFYSRKKALASEAEKSRFLAIMSHEIRTPMNGLIASLDLLRQPNDQAKSRHFIDQAYDSALSLLELLNSLLDHSRLESGRLSVMSTPFIAAPIIQTVCDAHRAAAEKKNLALTCDIDEALSRFHILSDAQRLGQILHNLLSNAIKFTDTGNVMLRATVLPGQQDLVTLQISVTDTGPGISEQERARLFRAWSQAGSAQHKGGSGLGLFICRRLAQLMKGSLSFESQLGEGASFTLLLPVATQEEGPGQTESDEMQPTLSQGLDILLVEDHPVNQDLIREQLRALGCQCDIAGDAASARRLLDEENYYDLALIDCNLPDEDGYALAASLRQIEQRQRREPMPMIAISALSDEGHYLKVKECGMNDVLTKPIILKALVNMLQKWCHTEAVEGEIKNKNAPSSTADEYFQAELTGFNGAMEQQNIDYMIHHLHRLRGVALMMNFMKLATEAGQYETKLRSEGIMDQEQGRMVLAHLQATMYQEQEERRTQAT